MKVFVIGSTGFLGYYTVLELLKQGHEVESLALTPLPDQVRFPEGVGLTLANLNQMEDDEIVARLKGMEGLIFAAGVDDRVVPPKPAYQFFYEHNVLATRRLIRLARQAGVRRAVVFSSYFVRFARRWAELKLGERHPYIRSRLEQIQAANEKPAGNDRQFLLLPTFLAHCPARCRCGNHS